MIHEMFAVLPSTIRHVLFGALWWCLKRRNPQMCTFGLSGCLVKPAAPKPPGLHTTAQANLYISTQRKRQSKSPHVHMWGSWPSKTRPKFNEKTRSETERWAGEGKGAKFWAEGGPAESKPTPTQTPTPPGMEGGSQNKCGWRRGAKGSEGWGPLSPGLGVQV